MPFTKPIVVVSRCLGFDACRYDGGMIPAAFVDELQRHVTFHTVCPEVEIGLGTPRDPIVLQTAERGVSLYQPSTERDLTDAMVGFAAHHLDALDAVDGFILKSRSPSCALRDAKITQRGSRVTASRHGTGVYAQAVQDRFPDLALEDEARLNNERIRDHFLTKLFALAGLRAISDPARATMGDLVRFHSRYKLVLMAYSQKHLRRMGPIVANAGRRPLRDVLDEYGSLFREALRRNARYTAHINVLMHAMGYFSDILVAAEKRHFLDLIEKYRRGVVPLRLLTTMLQSWIVRSDEPYLRGQAYFEPYPEALMDVPDKRVVKERVRAL